MTSSTRITWIDAAKGLSIILVTFMHMVLLTEKAGIEVWWLAKINDVLATVRMPLFFVAAGVFAGKALTLSWRDLFKSKIVFYLWLILIWTIFRWVMMRYFVTNPTNPTEGMDPAEILQAFYAPETGIWFLWTLAIFFIATKGLMKLGTVGCIVVSLVPSLAVLAAIVNDDFFTRPLLDNIAYRNTARYFPFFVIAAVAPQHVLKVGTWPKLVLPALAAACLALFWSANQTGNPLAFGVMMLLSSATGVAGMLILSRIVERTPVGRIIDYVGKNSLPIYVAQIPVISFLVGLLLLLGGHDNRAVAYPAMFIGTAATILITLMLRDVLVRLRAGWMYRLPHFTGASGLLSSRS